MRAARPPLVAAAVAAVAAGTWAGLARIGWQLPAERPEPIALHGPLMVFGFLGTVISLERAVALGRRWGYLAPAGSVAGVALLLAGRTRAGEAALLAAGLVLVGLFGLIVRTQATPATMTLALSALLWVLGVAVWIADGELGRAVPWWTGFLVLTILGERLELAALARLTTLGRRAFGGLTLLLAIALLLGGQIGARVLGVALAGFAVWLLRFDVARRTVRRPGLPRFVACSLLAGYGWLLVGGAVWVRHGLEAAGPVRDAQLHAIFVGFVFSMIFGHAPVIFPGVLGVPIPFRRAFYVHLAVLHAGVALRVAGDLAADDRLARDGALLNGIAIALFFAATALSALTHRLRRTMFI